MSEPKFKIVIIREVELGNINIPATETDVRLFDADAHPLLRACDTWGREKIVNVLLDALEQVRSHAAK